MHAGTKIVPPKTPTPLSPGTFAAIMLGATAMGVGAMVFFFNPSTHRFYPICMFHALTGLNCPGCGMTRALYALLHGNFRLALKDNALFVLTLIALVLWRARLILRNPKKQAMALNVSPRFLGIFLLLTIFFAIVRNLPGFDWLSP